MKRKQPTSSSPVLDHNNTTPSTGSTTMMEMIKSQRKRRKKIKEQQENNSSFIVDALHGICSDGNHVNFNTTNMINNNTTHHGDVQCTFNTHVRKQHHRTQQQQLDDLFNQVTINLLSLNLSKQDSLDELFRENIEKYIVHNSYQYSSSSSTENLLNQFIVYHIYLAQEILLCCLKSSNTTTTNKNSVVENVMIRDRLVEIGLKNILSFENMTPHNSDDRNSVIEYYFIRLFKFLNCEYICTVADRNRWIYMMSNAEFLQFTSRGIQKLFSIPPSSSSSSSEENTSLTLHMTTLSLLQESHIMSIPKFIMTCSDYFIDNLAERMLLENHSFETNPFIVQHFENVSYHTVWFITFNDKKRDTSKLMRFISNFRKPVATKKEGNTRPLMIWEKLTPIIASSIPPSPPTSSVHLKSYLTILKSSKKIIDTSLFHSFVLSEFYSFFQVSTTTTTERPYSEDSTFQNNKDPIYLTAEPGSDKAQDDVFQWMMDNLENFKENMNDILKELFLFPNLDFVAITNFITKLLKYHENVILKLLDELTLECINREDIPGCINCLIIGRNIYPIPKTMKPKNAVSSGNQHISTIDQWMKDNNFIFLSSGGGGNNSGGIERNTRHASFVIKLMEQIVPLENTLLLTIYQKILNNLINSRHELVSTLLSKIKKALQQSETQQHNNQETNEDSDYEEVKTILMEYEKFGENAYNTSSKSSILPLTYYPVMKKTRWCNVIVPQLISFTLRDCNDGIMKTKFDKLKSALISSLVNRKLIPKDVIQSEPTHHHPHHHQQKEDNPQTVDYNNILSTLSLKVSLVEGCLLRVVSEIENQIKKQSTNIDSLLALFFECHTAITDIADLMKSEILESKTRQSAQNRLVEIVLQSFYDCCMVMGSFSQHEGLLVTIMSDSQTSGNSATTTSNQRKQNHLDWIVLFKVSVLMPLSNVSSLIKDRVLSLLKNIGEKEPNSDLIFTISVLISSLITVSTNEITIIQEFIELTNKGKQTSAHINLKQGLEYRMSLMKTVCFSIWDEIKPKNFVESILFSKLIISCFEVCHHLQCYNSDFGESTNIIDCISYDILEETFQRSITEHFTSRSSQIGGNEFFCFIPSKMQVLHFWITCRYSQLFSQVDLSLRKSERADQVLKFTKNSKILLDKVKNLMTSVHSSFRNDFIENLFTGRILPEYDEWLSLELSIHDDICNNTLLLYYKTQFLQYNTLLSAQQSQNSLPYMLSTLFSKALSLRKPTYVCEHHSTMIQALTGLIPKFNSTTAADQFSQLDQFWLFKSWLPATFQQSNQDGNHRKCLFDFITFTDHLDPVIYFLGSYNSQSKFSQDDDFDSNLKMMKNLLSEFSTTCLWPLCHLHPWPVLFTSKILEGLFSLVVIGLSWNPAAASKRDERPTTAMKELKQVFYTFIEQCPTLKLNIIRNMNLHVSHLETWIFNYFSQCISGNSNSNNTEALLLRSKEILQHIIAKLEMDYSFGMKFLNETTPPALLSEILSRIDSKFAGLLVSDMLISLFIKPKASKHLDSYLELKEKSIMMMSSEQQFRSTSNNNKISIHSQTIIEYLASTETKLPLLSDATTTTTTDDTSKLSQIIELVFGRIGAMSNMNLTDDHHQEIWSGFFNHLLASLLVHYNAFVKRSLENSSSIIVPQQQNSPTVATVVDHNDVPRILETLIHQLLAASNPVTFISLANQALSGGGTISGIPILAAANLYQQDDNTQLVAAEHLWSITLALMQLLLANDEIIYCILNPQQQNTSSSPSPWLNLTSNTEFQTILSQLLDNVVSMALHNEISLLNSQRIIKLDRTTTTTTALNIARKLVQKQLLPESSIILNQSSR